MVYAAGKTDHTIEGVSMVERIIGLVEAKAAVIEAEKLSANDAAAQVMPTPLITGSAVAAE